MNQITERQRQWLSPRKIEEYYLDIDLGFSSQRDRDYQLYWAVLEGAVRAKHEGSILRGKALYALRMKKWSDDNMYALPADIELSVEDVKKIWRKKQPTSSNKTSDGSPLPNWVNELMAPAHYSEQVQEQDYSDYIIGGETKVHQLAALACDLSPPGNSGENKAYLRDIRNSRTSIGRICVKLVYAVNRNKIATLHDGLGAGVEWKIISASEGVAWLENEGNKVSERLKNYIAFSCDDAGKPLLDEPSSKKDDTKSAVFKLLSTELNGKKIGRKEARKWFAGKEYNSTWGDDFIKQLPPEQKRPRKRPRK